MSGEAARARWLRPVADHDLLVGYLVSRAGLSTLVLGADARLRSGTVLYGGTTIGRRLQTGHGVVVREGCVIGDDAPIADSASASPYRLTGGRAAKEPPP